VKKATLKTEIEVLHNRGTANFHALNVLALNFTSKMPKKG